MPSSQPRTPIHRPRTVLIVEDAEDTREFFAVTLADAGYRVLCAESVQEALTLLRAGGDVDVVIADYSLSDGTGAELIHQAANEGHLDLASTPALICTAYRYVELPPHVAIVHKPIGPVELVREVNGRVRR
jgi:CheY-like chemotaxis protein